MLKVGRALCEAIAVGEVVHHIGDVKDVRDGGVNVAWGVYWLLCVIVSVKVELRRCLFRVVFIFEEDSDVIAAVRSLRIIDFE